MIQVYRKKFLKFWPLNSISTTIWIRKPKLLSIRTELDLIQYFTQKSNFVCYNNIEALVSATGLPQYQPINGGYLSTAPKKFEVCPTE